MNRLPSETDAVTANALTWNGDGDLSQEVRTPVGGGAAPNTLPARNAA